MIKWDGFGKLLKQLFSISLIGFFGLFVGSSVNAQVSLLGMLQEIGQTYSSFYNNDYDILVNGKGNLLTQYFGEGKRLLYFQNGTYFFWSNSGVPYMSVSAYNGNYNNRVQGYVLYYFLCDYIDNGSVSNPTNCVRHDINDGQFNQVGSRILNSLNNSGYLFYNYYDLYARGISSPDYGGLDVCFSSSEFNKSLCFYGGFQYSKAYCESYYDNTLGKQFQYYDSWCLTYPSLTGSLGLGYTFDGISQSLLSFSPAGGGNGLGGSDSVIIDSIFTGDYSYSTCTYGNIINYLENNGFNKYLCYGGLDNFNLYDSGVNYSPVPGTGKTLFQIMTNVGFSTWGSPVDWFNYWNGLYKDIYNGVDNGYISMWESYPAVMRTWFDLYYRYGGNNLDFDTVREYCISVINPDFDSSQEYKGSFIPFNNVCSNIIHGGSNYIGSGQVAVGVNWDGVGNMGGNTINNPKIAIQSFFDRLKSNMTTDYFGLGSIPQYIIFFLLALILFRFLAH